MARRREFQQQRDRDSNQNDGGRQGRPGNEAQVVYAGGRGSRGGSDAAN